MAGRARPNVISASLTPATAETLRRFCYSHDLGATSVIDTLIAWSLEDPDQWATFAEWVRGNGGAKRRNWKVPNE
jgi:hypothetical protein